MTFVYVLKLCRATRLTTAMVQDVLDLDNHNLTFRSELPFSIFASKFKIHGDSFKEKSTISIFESLDFVLPISKKRESPFFSEE